MISKSDWQDAYSDLLADGRRRLAPPTVEEVEALFGGELVPAEAERVRELLAHYPDMAKAMTDGALAADLAAADQEEMVGAPPAIFPKRSLPAPALAIAASLIVLAVGGIYFKTLRPSESREIVTRVLDADGERGGFTTRGAGSGQTPIQLSTATDYELKPLFRPPRTFGEYRLELFDLGTSPPRVVWSVNGVERATDGSFPVKLATAKLSPGLYELVLYGVDAGQTQRLATYTIRFSAS
jgi:hypothetical protein